MSLAFALGAALLALTTPGDVVVRHTAYAPGPRGGMDVYAPRRAADAPMAVFFYGGSWQSGDRDVYRFVGRALASRGLVVAIPDYRVHPHADYPDFLHDCAAAVAFAQAHATAWGASPRRLFLIGHSAGAYNAAMLALDRRWLAGVGLDPDQAVAGMVGLAGPYDFLPLTDPKLMTIFGPESGRRATQPITWARAGAPPMLLLAGLDDKVVDPGNSTRLAAAVLAVGGKAQARLLAGFNHVSILTALSGLLRRPPVLDEISGFVRATPAPAETAAAPRLRLVGGRRA